MTYGLIFDIDNILLEPVPHITDSIMAYLHDQGEEVSRASVNLAYCQAENWRCGQIYEELKTGALLPNSQYLKHILDIYCEQIGYDGEGFRAFLTACLDASKEYQLKNPHVPETLERLSGKGYHLAIAGDYTSGIRDQLERYSIAQYFEAIVLSEEEKFLKPDSRLINNACSRMGVDLKDCVYISSQVYDILYAYLAGTRSIFCPYYIDRFEAPPFIPQPDGVAADITQIEPLLVSLWKTKKKRIK